MQVVIDDELIDQNGGFVVDPFPGTGRSTIIYAYDASLWVNEHYREFNWG